MDQARWFASKDLIIAAHGAALTNSVFITKGTIVLQLYPPFFYWQFYDPLITQSGGLALGYAPGENPIADLGTLVHNPARKNQVQHQNFTVDVEKVAEMVLVAVDEKDASEEMIKNSYWR